MTKKIYKESILTALPATSDMKYLPGYKVKVKSGDRFKSYILSPEREWIFDQGITDSEQAKLTGLKNQDEINADIQGAKTYTDEKVKQTLAETIPISGTVLPRGAQVPSWVTISAKATIYGKVGGTTYTNTGTTPASFVIPEGYMLQITYVKATDIWTGNVADVVLYKGTDGASLLEVWSTGSLNYPYKINTQVRDATGKVFVSLVANNNFVLTDVTKWKPIGGTPLNTLTSASVEEPLSANMGKTLNEVKITKYSRGIYLEQTIKV